MAADPATDVELNPELDDAQPGAQDGNEPQSDPAAARQPEKGDKPGTGGDDSDSTSDPLVLAQMEPETTEAKTPQKVETPKQTTTTPKTPEPAKAEAPKVLAKPADAAKDDEAPPKQEVDQDEAEALADLPPEDWSKVSHKTKSQFLAQRKVIRSSAERLKSVEEARKAAEDNYAAVETFVRDQGLGDEEYVNAVAIAGLIKKADPKVVPVLEQTLQNIRKALGQPEQKPQAAALTLDAELAAVLKEAEDYGIDTAKVRSKFTPPPAKEPAAPAATPPKAESRAPAPAAAQDGENQAILESLIGLGVDPETVVDHVKGLITADPKLAQVPEGKRLRAILQAHTAAASKARPQTRTTEQPLSGRGRPGLGAGRTTTTTSDPLKLAMQPRGRQ